MAPGIINVEQFVKFIEEKGPQILLPQNLPEKWLLRLYEAAVGAKKTQKTSPLAIRLAVLSLKERRAVKERDVPIREKKYNALDFEAWILLYSRDLEFEAVRRQGGSDKLKTDPAYLQRIENPPAIEDYFEH